MKSKIEKRNYIVLLDDERYPYKINRKYMDKNIAILKSSLEKIKSVLKNTYNEDYSTYDVLFQHCMDYPLDVNDGKSWKLNSYIEALDELQEVLLTHNDEIKPIEEVSTLEDFGFRLWVWEKGIYVYEKCLFESDEKEIIEEILNTKDGRLIRRTRTTLWESTSYGKSSKSIVYDTLRMTKQLKTAFYNSVKEYEAKCNRSY